MVLQRLVYGTATINGKVISGITTTTPGGVTTSAVGSVYRTVFDACLLTMAFVCGLGTKTVVPGNQRKRAVSLALFPSPPHITLA